MIRHLVMLNAANNSELQSVMDGLAALVGHIEGFSAFEHGPNRDYEGKSPDHSYGFVATFDGEKPLTRYANDPQHQALGERLVALCSGGADGIVVYDIEV